MDWVKDEGLKEAGVEKDEEADMKIAISSSGKKLSDPVDERFGRAAYLLIYDTEAKQFSALDNQSNVEAASGAGPQAVDFIATHGVEVLLTGNVGPKAAMALHAAKIKSYAVTGISAKEAIDRYERGELNEIS